MSRFLAVAALSLVAGCGQQREADRTPGNETATPAAASAPVADLGGEWQVVKLDGRPIAGGSAVSFSQGKARLTAGCTRRAWAYTQQRNIVSFAADSSGSANCETTPSIEQESVIHALDRATMAIFDKDGREASLSGNGGNVTLERR